MQLKMEVVPYQRKPRPSQQGLCDCGCGETLPEYPLTEQDYKFTDWRHRCQMWEKYRSDRQLAAARAQEAQME